MTDLPEPGTGRSMSEVPRSVGRKILMRGIQVHKGKGSPEYEYGEEITAIVRWSAPREAYYRTIPERWTPVDRSFVFMADPVEWWPLG